MRIRVSTLALSCALLFFAVTTLALAIAFPIAFVMKGKDDDKASRDHHRDYFIGAGHTKMNRGYYMRSGDEWSYMYLHGHNMIIDSYRTTYGVDHSCMGDGDEIHKFSISCDAIKGYTYFLSLDGRCSHNFYKRKRILVSDPSSCELELQPMDGFAWIMESDTVHAALSNGNGKNNANSRRRLKETQQEQTVCDRLKKQQNKAFVGDGSSTFSDNTPKCNPKTVLSKKFSNCFGNDADGDSLKFTNGSCADAHTSSETGDVTITMKSDVVVAFSLLTTSQLTKVSDPGVEKLLQDADEIVSDAVTAIESLFDGGGLSFQLGGGANLEGSIGSWSKFKKKMHFNNVHSDKVNLNFFSGFGIMNRIVQVSAEFTVRGSVQLQEKTVFTADPEIIGGGMELRGCMKESCESHKMVAYYPSSLDFIKYTEKVKGGGGASVDLTVNVKGIASVKTGLHATAKIKNKDLTSTTLMCSLDIHPVFEIQGGAVLNALPPVAPILKNLSAAATDELDKYLYYSTGAGGVKCSHVPQNIDKIFGSYKDLDL